MKYSGKDDTFSVFRANANAHDTNDTNDTNGNARDHHGRLVTCEQCVESHCPV